MSQAELAERMTAHGLPGFYPQTITKIEAGTRDLKFREGLVMAEILGVDPYALVGRGTGADTGGVLVEADKALAALWAVMASLERALEDLMGMSHSLVALLDQLHENISATATAFAAAGLEVPESTRDRAIAYALDQGWTAHSPNHELVQCLVRIQNRKGRQVLKKVGWHG